MKPTAHRYPTPLWRSVARLLGRFGCLLSVLSGVPLLRAQTLYWDINGTTAGAGVTPTGTWNTTNGAKNWNTSSAGTSSVVPWTAGNDAVFSAGTDATGAYTVTLGASMTVGNLTFEEGTTTITGNTLTFNRSGGSTIDVASGLTSTVDSILGGSVALTKTGDGTFVTGGSSGNTHTGAININGGVFEIAKTAYVGGINNSAAVSIAAGATLRLNGTAAYTQETIGTLSGAGTVTNVGAANVNFVISGAGNTTFSGTITDGTNDLVLIKNVGTGTLTLSGANSYDGATTISTGAINIQNSTALGTTVGGTTVASGAALEIQNNITVGAETLNLSGTGIGGNGALRNISGTNSFAGAITLATASKIQSDAGTLILSGGISSANLGLTVSGAGNTTVSGVVALGTGGITKTDAGTLTLSAANTYTGTTFVQAGTLVISDQTASGTIDTSSGATTQFDVASGTRDNWSGNTIFTGTGTLAKTGAGAMVWGGASATFALGSGSLIDVREGTFVGGSYANENWTANLSSLNVEAGAVFSGVEANVRVDALTGSGTIKSGYTGSGYSNFTFGVNNGSGTFSGTIADGAAAGNFVKAGTGTQTFSGANTYTGTTTISAGVLNIQNNTALGTTAAGTTVASGAALEIQNNITVGAEALSLSGTGVSGNGALRNISGTNSFAGAVTLAAASEIQSDAGTLTLSGNLSSANLGLTLDGAGNTTLSGVVALGSAGITKNGPGTVTLSGTSANTFTGALTINDGTVQLAKTGSVNAASGNIVTIGDSSGAASSANLVLQSYQQLPDTAAVTINSDGRFALNNFSEKIDTIAGTGLIDLSTSGFLTVGTSNGSSSFNGSISGTGTLIKEGTGTLTFNSAINFGGELTLSGGTLALNATTLTVGTLHITGNTILDFGLSTASTLTATNFIIDAGATLTINNWVNGVDSFIASNWTGATLDTNNAAPMNQITFTGFTAANTQWLSYDHQITPVPEPSTYGALFVAGAAAFVFWRRRRSSTRAA